MSILIKTFHRSLHKMGQQKAQLLGLDAITTRELHPNVRNNDFWIAGTFGVFLGGKVKILKSDIKELETGLVYELQFINDLVLKKSLAGEKTTTVQEL